MLSEMERVKRSHILNLSSIYGISFSYPSTPSDLHDVSREDGFIGGIPVIRTSALSMGIWDRIFKRTYDIILSTLALVFLSPLFLLIMLAIKIEDPSGPVIYKNRRIGMR